MSCPYGGRRLQTAARKMKTRPREEMSVPKTMKRQWKQCQPAPESSPAGTGGVLHTWPPRRKEREGPTWMVRLGSVVRSGESAPGQYQPETWGSPRQARSCSLGCGPQCVWAQREYWNVFSQNSGGNFWREPQEPRCRAGRSRAGLLSLSSLCPGCPAPPT